MNRRNFFKAATGFIAGIFAAKAKPKPQLTVAMLRDVAEQLKIEAAHPPTMYIHPVAYAVYPDGKIEPISYKDFYKNNS